MRVIDNEKPTILGSGLIALDLIVTSTGAVFHSVGGTCANVLGLLAAHGVDARPIGKIGDDVAGDLICAHMTELGSDLSLIRRGSGTRSPRIVELAPSNGASQHRFAFTCPKCSRRLPRSHGVTEEEATNLEIDWSRVDLFFFDRATPAGIYLAKRANDSGVPVMFEPPKSLSDNRLCQAVAVADIVKYSCQDFRDGLPSAVVREVQLVIETQDGKGLRYRQRRGGTLGDWHTLPAFEPVRPRDAAGAGDWCTAGFIWEIVRGRTTWNWTTAELESAMAYGQALAAISVCYIGPLGALFALSRNELVSAAQEVLLQGSVPERARKQGGSNGAFAPGWPQDVLQPYRACEVCLLECPLP